jgi:glycosyltransferase involved in cell wall biosynthesis
VTRRVLMTTTAYPPSIGGVQSYLFDLVSRLEHFEAEVVSLWLEHRNDWLLGTTLRLGEPEPAATGTVRRLGWSRSARARMAPWVLAYYGLVPVAARRIAAVMAPALDRLVTPEHVIVHAHRIGREFLAMASLDVARGRGLPFVLTPYHHPRWHGYRYSGWTNVYRAADAVLTLTEAESRELQRLGVRQDRLFVIGGAGDEPLAADAARFRKRIGGGSRPIVLFLGQLYDYKGVATLYEAAISLRRRGVEVDLVYIGPETTFSRRFFEQRPLPWVHVLGPVDNLTKWDAIAASTVVCVPSAQESFGRVYIEAWALARPVIGARIPSVTEVITDGETGLLVEAGSPSPLEQALDRLLKDPSLAQRLGEAGREERNRRFTWKQVVSRVERVYEGLLERSTAGRPT